MRMGCFLSSGAFWGVLLILIGILLIVKVVFNVNIPIFRVLFAVFLIWLGIRVLIGGFWCDQRRNTVFFEESRAASASAPEYHVIFGKGAADLSGVDVSAGTVKKEVSTVFGSSTITIGAGQPVKITVDAAFAGARMPDGNLVSFGSYTYVSPAFKDAAPYLLVRAHVVFGSLDIIEKK